jgi:hypothetical protein
LFNGLNFPVAVTLDNNVVLVGEEVFLFGLRRMVYPSRLIDLLPEFGGEISTWSRAFSFFIDYIYSNYKSLVFNGMQHFVREFAIYAAAIKKKLSKKAVDT